MYIVQELIVSSVLIILAWEIRTLKRRVREMENVHSRE